VVDIALIFLSCTYAIFLCMLCIGISKNSYIRTANITKNYSVSVLVAVRNGAKTISELFEILIKQDYKGSMEFIIIDDESSDNTKDIIFSYMAKDFRFKYACSIDGDPNLSLKKRALDAGIKISSNNILLFTDMDCRPVRSWVRCMVESLQHDTDYLIGMSYALKQNTIVSKFQSIDFYFLMKSALALTGINLGNASSGQNILYKKTIYNHANGFSKISNCLQGDDTLFLQIVKKFANVAGANIDGYVICRTEKNWLSLIKQRVRWAGDANIMWKFNSYFYFVMLAIFIYSLLLVVCTIYSLYYQDFWIVLICSIICKFLLEFFFLHFKKSHPQRFSFFEFLLWFIIQPFYIVLVGLGSFIADQLSWRGRTIQ